MYRGFTSFILNGKFFQSQYSHSYLASFTLIHLSLSHVGHVFLVSTSTSYSKKVLFPMAQLLVDKGERGKLMEFK